MRHKYNIGFDEWYITMDIHDYMSIVKQYELELYDITISHRDVIFYTNIWQRHRVYNAFPYIKLHRTTGMLGYFLRSLKKPSRWLALLLSCMLWYGLSHIVFAIDIVGEQDESRVLIQQTLQKLKYHIPFYDDDVHAMKKKLKKQLEHEIAWLEVVKKGSRYLITYTPKETASLMSLKHDELIAQEDGVIQRFDVLHGNKMKKVNDYVHAGDVLVSNILEDSVGKKEEVYVDGRVYAYTWKDVSVTMDDTSMPKSFQYFELLLQARSEVAGGFREGDRIYNENILQFSKDMGKIKMVIHYTLCKDITTP